VHGCVLFHFCNGELNWSCAAVRSLRGVRTQIGVESDEAPDEIARETRMVKPKSCKERLLMTT
jgi:hypothetical protein